MLKRPDSEETLTDKEQTTHQNQPNIQSYKAQSYLKLSQNKRFQEIISISSDSEKETKSEPKKSDKELWKFRNPKKEQQILHNTIKSLRDDMMSKDSERLERSKTRASSIMHPISSLMAKPSYKNNSPSNISSLPSLKSFSDTRVVQPSLGSFHVQDIRKML